MEAYEGALLLFVALLASVSLWDVAPDLLAPYWFWVVSLLVFVPVEHFLQEQLVYRRGYVWRQTCRHKHLDRWVYKL